MLHSLIQKLLHKRGINSYDELDVEEKQTFDTWQAVLSKEQLTTEDIKQFCQSQVSVIEGKWKDLSLENAKKAELIPYHSVYKSLLTAIDAPKAAREAIEQQLLQLVNA